MAKKNAFVEHRPLSSDKNASVTHHVVIMDGKIVKETKTQEEAATWAKAQGYAVHVARERHLQNHDQPAHWRAYS